MSNIDESGRSRASLALILVGAAVVLAAVIAVVALDPGRSTAGSTVSYSRFLDDVRQGRVTSVEQSGETLTVAAGSDRYAVLVPTILTDVYGDMQAAGEDGGVTLPVGVFSASPAQDMSWIGMLLTGLLPLAIVLVAFGALVYVLGRRQGPDVTSRLRALDAAWRAGMITDNERERKRTQIIDGI